MARDKKTLTDTDSLMSALEELSFEQLQQFLLHATRTRDDRKKEVLNDFVRDIRARADILGLDLDEIVEKLASFSVKPNSVKFRSGDKRRIVKIKYRGPNGEAWSGRGRPPRWIQVLEIEGGSREDFRVTEGE